LSKPISGFLPVLDRLVVFSVRLLTFTLSIAASENCIAYNTSVALQKALVPSSVINRYHWEAGEELRRDDRVALNEIVLSGPCSTAVGKTGHQKGSQGMRAQVHETQSSYL
jgi:hypothetical protein